MSELAFCAGLLLVAHAAAPILPVQSEATLDWSVRNAGIIAMASGLLLCWVPIIGDPLTVIAGVMKEPLTHFVVLVAVAKVTRYLCLAAITQNWA